MNIIQHHKPIDFDALFKQMQRAVVGLDSNDIELFATDDDEIHSFYGSAECGDRIGNAFGIALCSDEAAEIVNKCDTFMLFFKYNPKSERPVSMVEMSAINKFVTGLSDDCNIMWNLMSDSTIGDKVEIILLCNLKG